MKSLNVTVSLRYDQTRLSPPEVVYNLRQALDVYFERYDDYDDALELDGVTVENTSVVYGGDSE